MRAPQRRPRQRSRQRSRQRHRLRHRLRHRGSRAGALAVALVLVAGLAGGCGTSQRERYCATLKSEQEKLGEMTNSTRADAVVRALPTLRTLAEQAPDDLADEWQTFLNAVEGLQQAFRDSGLTSAQLAKGEVPADLSEARKERLAAAAQRIGSPDVLDAASGIEHQAADVCHVTIGL